MLARWHQLGGPSRGFTYTSEEKGEATIASRAPIKRQSKKKKLIGQTAGTNLRELEIGSDVRDQLADLYANDDLVEAVKAMTSMKPTDTVPPSTLLDAAKKAAPERSDKVKEAKEAADKMFAVAPSALPLLPGTIF